MTARLNVALGGIRRRGGDKRSLYRIRDRTLDGGAPVMAETGRICGVSRSWSPVFDFEVHCTAELNRVGHCSRLGP
jgi:hypothetical protein